MINIDLKDWEKLDINVNSLWVIPGRDKSGKHSNIYHGNFIPQIPNQMIRRYTSEKDTVLDLFMGSGTTLFECEKLNRNFIGFDINKSIIDFVRGKMNGTQNIQYSICDCDVTNTVQFESIIKQEFDKIGINEVQFLIAHPPYMDIVHFTDLQNDLSNIDNLDIFLEKLLLAFTNALRYLPKSRYFSVVIGDVYKKSEVVPLGFYVLDMIKRNFKVKLKGIIVKNIEGNRGKIGTQNNIWKYRALKSDYFIFKHEYILVFKKE